MLEHQKMVIKGVAENAELFKKELVKSLVWLNAYEITQLRKWVRDNFWTKYPKIIKDVFYPRFVRV